ncbi:MAG: GIY-YIG nuclease family protein [Candidatus Thermoplasmatota archaeon]|jgi:excinuclease UvrABC nuclease subunit|nr:GIY-YIG nuclease family protein [Candidatus Thermoplasmatota archaeon]
MDSASLSDFGSPSDFTSAQSQAPILPGSYLLRMKGAVAFPRIKGKTDILYIGSTANLKKRFYSYNHPDKSQYTNQKVNNFVISYQHDAEFMWISIPDPERARVTENELLRKYQEDHHELPPLNGASVRSLKLTLPPEKLNFKDEVSIE